MAENTGHKTVLNVPFIPGFHGNIDMHAVPCFSRHGLWGKIGVQTVAQGNGLHNGTEVHGIVRRSQRIGVAEVDLVLPRPLLVVGAFRQNSHAFQRQADFPPYIFTPVLRCNVQITCPVKGLCGRRAVFIGFKQVKFKFRPEEDCQTLCGRRSDGLFQNPPAVQRKRRAVRAENPAEHPDNLPCGRTPGERGQGGRDRNEKQIGIFRTAKPGNGGGVKADALGKGPGKLLRHDGYVFLLSGKITEGQPDKLYVLLLNIVKDILFRVQHGNSPWGVEIIKNYTHSVGMCQFFFGLLQQAICRNANRTM